MTESGLGDNLDDPLEKYKKARRTKFDGSRLSMKEITSIAKRTIDAPHDADGVILDYLCRQQWIIEDIAKKKGLSDLETQLLIKRLREELEIRRQRGEQGGELLR